MFKFLKKKKENELAKKLAHGIKRIRNHTYDLVDPKEVLKTIRELSEHYLQVFDEGVDK